MSTGRGTCNTTRAESVGTSPGAVTRKSDSKVTVLAIEQALSELGRHASLSEIIAKAQIIENRIVQSRSRRKQEHPC